MPLASFCYTKDETVAHPSKWISLTQSFTVLNSDKSDELPPCCPLLGVQVNQREFFLYSLFIML